MREAMELLVRLGEIEHWVKSADPRADPYLEAGAVKILPNGEVAFCREKFIEVESHGRGGM